MNVEQMRRIALLAMTVKIKNTLDVPNSDMSKKIAETMSDVTGISHLEIHRFNNAVINDNVLNSFKSERIDEISWALLKAAIIREKKLPNSHLRGSLSSFANTNDLSLNEVLETFRTAFHEIIDEALTPQKKA